MRYTVWRLSAVALVAPVLVACGMRYERPPVVPAETRAGASGADSLRAFFDSLEQARAADTLPPELPVRPLSPRVLPAASLADLDWLDVLQDTVLTTLARRALLGNRDLEIEQARIREYRAAAGVARSGLFPNLALNASAARTKVAFGTLTIPPYTAWRATADVAWELDLFGLPPRIRAASADLAAQEAYERATALVLVSDVATGYLQLLELDQERATAQQTLASRQATLDLARERYDRGIISELDVRQFEAQVAVPAVHLAQVEQARARSEHALNVLLGEGPAAIPRGTSLARAARAVSVPDSVPVALLERRPDVQAAERRYAAAAARVGVAAAARLPALMITGSWGAQSATVGDLTASDSRVYQILAGISFPIFTGGRLVGQQRAAAARADQARAAYQQSVLTALQEAGDALVGVRTARDQLAAQETQAEALRRALDLATMRYQSGVSNYLEVLDAQRSLFGAQLAESQAQLQQLLAAVQLYKALGGSWPDKDPDRR
jgi:outer membrane protein, multidrug efflux system